MTGRLIVLALLATLAACGSEAGGGGGVSDDLLLTQLPSPLPQTVTTSQDLTTPAQVAAATPADPTTVTRALAGSSFQRAHVRIWSRDAQSYVTLIAVTFAHPADASRMVQVEIQDLQGGSNTFATPHADLPGSYVFVIHGATRQGEHAVVCEGVWAPVTTVAVEALTCSPNGAWATQAEQLARQESDRIMQVNGK